jgi:hypothetical protein
VPVEVVVVARMGEIDGMLHPATSSTLIATSTGGRQRSILVIHCLQALHKSMAKAAPPWKSQYQ